MSARAAAGFGAFAALVSAFVPGCDPQSIQAVGGPGGVYRPGQGCTLAPGAPVCPPPSEAGASRLDFESNGDPQVVPDQSPGNLGGVSVSCAHSYCGTGSLTAHADLTWANDDPNYPQRMASFSHAFAPAVDLYGKTIGFSVYVDAVTVPMHAQVGVIFDYWRWIGWSPLSPGWNRIEGVVSPANPLSKIDSTVTAIPVTSIRMDVYVPVAGASGSQGTWSGEIFLDDVSW